MQGHRTAQHMTQCDHTICQQQLCNAVHITQPISSTTHGRASSACVGAQQQLHVGSASAGPHMACVPCSGINYSVPAMY